MSTYWLDRDGFYVTDGSEIKRTNEQWPAPYDGPSTICSCIDSPYGQCEQCSPHNTGER